MKILFVSNRYGKSAVGGYEMNCADIARALVARGHEVTVLTARGGGGEDRDAGVRVVASLLRETPHESALATLRAMVWNPVRELVNRRALAQLDGHDHIVVWNAVDLGGGFIRDLAPRSIFYLLDGWLRARLDRDPPARPARLAFCSESLKAEYGTKIEPGTASAVIPLGVDPDQFAVATRQLDQPALQQILYCGRVSPEKGVATLLRALSIARREGPFRLTIAGSFSGPAYRATLESLVRELGLVADVRFAPAVPRLELKAVYASHGCLAFPSEWCEPFGLSVVEGMLSGLAVVATDRCGPSEIVEDGVSGRLVPPGDPRALAAALVANASDPTAATTMAQRGARVAGDTFSLQTQVNRLEAFVVGWPADAVR